MHIFLGRIVNVYWDYGLTSGGSYGRIYQSIPADFSDSFQLYKFDYDSSVDTLSFDYNGIEYQSGIADISSIVDINGQTGFELFLGRDDNNNDRYLNGDVAEVLIFDSVLTDDQVSKVNYYLSKKWGLTAAVDSDGDGLTDAQDGMPMSSGFSRDANFTYSFGGYSCHDLYNRGVVAYNSNVNITLSHEGVDEDSYTGRCVWWNNKPGTLLMQAIEGSTTFQYSASYWTTDNTLDGDGYVGFLSNNRKYDAYNSMIMTDVFTRIKNTGSYDYYWGWESVKPGTGLDIFDNHKYTWTDDSGYTNYSYYKMQKYGTTAYNSAVSSYPAFSYQSGDTIWGIGFNSQVRWGITGNQENDLRSNDTRGGIGVSNRSAGDYVGCCQNYTGSATNQYAGFELVGYDEIVIPDFSTEVELFQIVKY